MMFSREVFHFCHSRVERIVIVMHALRASELMLLTRHASRRTCSSLAEKSKEADRELLSRLKSILTGNAGTKKKDGGDPLLTRLKRILVGRNDAESSKADEAPCKASAGDETGLAPHASMIEAFCKTGKFEQAYKGAMAMLSQGLALDASVLKTLLYGLYKCGRVIESKNLAREMIVRNQSLVVKETFQGLLQQDVLFYSTLVEGLCRAGRVDEAYSVFTGPGVKTSYSFPACRTLVQALDDLGRAEQVFRVAFFMLSNGMAVRREIFNPIIGRLCDAGHHELLLKACFRDNFTTLDHKRVLLELCERGKVDEASQFLVDMAESDAQAFAEMMPKVCDVILAKGEHELLFRCTRSSRVQHTAATYSILIGALCSANKGEEARRMIAEMRARGYEPDSSTLALLKPFTVDAAKAVKKLIREGNEERALELYNKALAAGTTLKLDIASYNALLRQLWSSGRETEALRLFQQISRSGLVPDATTCGILVAGLCGVKKPGAAFKIVQTMPGLGCVPDHNTYTTLLSSACNGDDFGLVELVIEEMHENGLRPDYDNALICYSRREKFAEMKNLFMVMISRGCKPSETLCQLVVGRLCEANFLDGAWDVIQRVEKTCYSLSQGIYQAYFVGLLKAGEVELARHRSKSLDSAFLFRCYVEAGLLTEACSHYRKMVEDKVCDPVQVLVEVICVCKSGAAAAIKLLSDDSSGISKVIQGLIAVRRLDSVVELLVQWAQTRDEKLRDRTCSMFDEMIMDMCKLQRFEEATKVLEGLFAKGTLARLKT